jgi:GntR family transcriptional regulator, transcriptional repressor for pyruvate dehydrogenase complex
METIKKTNLSEAVAQRLLALISNGELKVGDKLPSEPQLCTMLGVSRTAVREGIKALAGINILSVMPGRGTFVNESSDIMVNDDALKIAFDRETIESLYQARYALDVGIARFVVSNANEEDIKVLRKNVRKMEAALKSKPMDLKSAAESDEEFHLAFCRASHNKILENIAQPIITHAVVRVWKQIKGSPKFGKGALKGHKKILQGVEKRDVRMVMDAVQEHLEVVFEGIGKNRDNHNSASVDKTGIASVWAYPHREE